MQASGFEEKEVRDGPACLLSPGIREDPGSSVTAQGVCVYCTCSSWVGAWSSQGSALGLWRVFLEQGWPRAIGGLGGKAWQAWCKERGHDGGKQMPSRVHQEEAPLSKDATREGDPDVCSWREGRGTGGGGLSPPSSFALLGSCYCADIP